MISISVVIPVHNAGPRLDQAIGSVQRQSMSPDEVIVVDDGSTDDVAGRVRRLAPGATCIRQPWRGVAHARNAGIEVASGRWIAFLDADDRWRPQKLERQLGALPRVSDDVGCLYGRHATLAAGVSVLSRVPPRHGQLELADLLRRNWIGMSTALVRREAVARVGGFDGDLRAAVDWDLWLRMAAAGERFVYLPQLLAECHWSSDGLTRQLELKTCAVERVLDKLFARRDLPAEIRRLEPRARGWAHASLARVASITGDWRRTAHHLRQAWRHSPTLGLQATTPVLLAMGAGLALRGKLRGLARVPLGRLRRLPLEDGGEARRILWP